MHKTDTFDINYNKTSNQYESARIGNCCCFVSHRETSETLATRSFYSILIWFNRQDRVTSMFLSKFSRNSDLPCAEPTRFREFLFFLLDIFIIHTLTQCFARKNGSCLFQWFWKYVDEKCIFCILKSIILVKV